MLIRISFSVQHPSKLSPGRTSPYAMSVSWVPRFHLGSFSVIPVSRCKASSLIGLCLIQSIPMRVLGAKAFITAKGFMASRPTGRSQCLRVLIAAAVANTSYLYNGFWHQSAILLGFGSVTCHQQATGPGEWRVACGCLGAPFTF